MIVLIVKQEFGGYKVGDKITDEKTMKEVLLSENAGHVVRACVPDEVVEIQSWAH